MTISVKAIGITLALLGVIAGAYFAVTSYRDMAAQNQTLKGKVTQLEADAKAEKAAQERIAKTIDTNDTNTTRVIERTREIERQINAAPKTNDCISSPAIGALLDGLRNDEQQPGS